MTSQNTKIIMKMINDKRQVSNKDFYTHTSLCPPARLMINRESLEELYNTLGNSLTDSNFISTIAEMPQNYSMLRIDIDKKVEISQGENPKDLYSIFEVINLVKSIQQYLRENIDGLQNKHLDCAFLSKKPYLSISEKDGKIYNKHGFHLQFINCFLSKEDNKRLSEHFHHLDKNFDKIYNHPWLMYGCQKKKESGRYEVQTIISHDGNCLTSEEYFKKYSIYDIQEKKIEYTKPVSFYYPRIFSINSFNRDTIDFKPEINNYTQHSKKLDYF